MHIVPVSTDTTSSGEPFGIEPPWWNDYPKAEALCWPTGWSPAERACWTREEWDAEEQICAVYMLLGAPRDLLYVGISENPGRRIGQHATAKDWFVEIGRIEIRWFGSRSLASAIERRIIETVNPFYNVAMRTTPVLT